MNSRDAAFDDQLQEIIEATAAEAAAHASHEPEPEVHINGRAKRKRTAEDDTCVAYLNCSKSPRLLTYQTQSLG